MTVNPRIPTPSPETIASRKLRWQIATVGMIVVGYAAYYVCRSNFSVCLPLIRDELVAAGMTKDAATIRLGTVASLGVLAYAFGKFLNGALSDLTGGRVTFVGGMLGSVLATIAFTMGGGIPIFTVAWIANRLVQSMGWVGIVKITGRWFSFHRYGSVMGIISLSYLFGDAAARSFMANLIGDGLDWRSVFYACAGVLLAVCICAFFVIRESPRSLNLPEGDESPQSLYDDTSSKDTSLGLSDLLKPLLKNPAFLLICFLSLALTLVRETFNTWTPTYFSEALGFSAAIAAEKSALFPLFGGLSVLVAGFLSDRLGHAGRALIIVWGLALAVLTLLGLAHDVVLLPSISQVTLVSATAFLLLGPYSYLAGAVALDFGGKKGSGIVCGVIDGVGYFGGILAGDTMARISTEFGWTGAFTFLAAVTGAGAIAGLLYLAIIRKNPVRTAPVSS